MIIKKQTRSLKRFDSKLIKHRLYFVFCFYSVLRADVKFVQVLSSLPAPTPSTLDATSRPCSTTMLTAVARTQRTP